MGIVGAIEMSRRRDILPWSFHREVAALTPDLQDNALDWAEDRWRKQATALETYMRGKDMQRRIEGRIGQLLGSEPGRGGKEMNPHADSFHQERRKEFCLLLPFQKSHTKRLVRIAGCKRLRPHVGVLPDDSTGTSGTDGSQITALPTTANHHQMA